MYFGGDYNPEQWPESVWDDDMRLMNQAGVNLVSVGIFSWARLQRAEGEFDFGWLDRLLDKLNENGIGVDLATATASPPPWLVKAYPNVLPVTEAGVQLSLGSRQHYAPTSPDYRRLAADLVTALAGRYASHPAVKLWHVNNEYACHIQADYSDHAERAFRVWLADRYGDIDSLNAAWGTSFWSQRYGNFDEVRPPRLAPTTQNPGSVLDFRRFMSDSVLELYTMERDILRAAGVTQPITTNFMGAFFALDYWRWAEEVDVVSDDNYTDPREVDAYHQAAFTRDLMRSLKPGVPWLLMEQAPGAVQWRPNNAPKLPGQMAAWSEQALARGADGIMYFQWRQSRAGQEKFHSAMLPQSGTRSRTWREVKSLGESLRGRQTARPLRGDVAIVFEWQNWWALTQPDLPSDVDYFATVFGWYRALHAANIQTSFVRPGDDLSEFALVVAPALYLLDDVGAGGLREFVRTGGVLVTTAFTDIVDTADRFRNDGYSTQLAEVLGGEPLDFYGVEAADARTAEVVDGTSFAPTTMIEDFLPSTGDVLARTDRDEVALVRNSFGAGVSLHFATFPDAAGTELAVRLAADLAGVLPVLADAAPGIEAVATETGMTIINQSGHAQSVQLAGGDVLELDAFEVRHLERAIPPRSNSGSTEDNRNTAKGNV